jgi:hypothetical protein
VRFPLSSLLSLRLSRTARDVPLGLLMTGRTLGLSFFTYLGGCLGLNTDQPKIPPLAILVARAI